MLYPGFLQLHGFMSMNLDRHIEAHRKLFLHLVQADGDSAQKHREFYDEYLAVMDLAAEFYLQTVETVFIRHALPKGEMAHRGVRIDPAKIHRVALLTVEGENDDISGVGQTEAAHPLCVNAGASSRIGCSRPWVTTACSTARVSARDRAAHRRLRAQQQCQPHAQRPHRTVLPWLEHGGGGHGSAPAATAALKIVSDQGLKRSRPVT